MAKIPGNPVGTTMPRPDWNQTDPTKADFIKNKPIYSTDCITDGYAYQITSFKPDSAANTTTFRIATKTPPVLENLIGVTDGNIVSVVLYFHKDRLGKATSITEVDAGLYDIAVNAYWLDEDYTNDTPADGWYEVHQGQNNLLRFPLHPELGDVKISVHNFVTGLNNRVAAYGAFAAGEGNSAEGKYAAAFGKSNVAGYATLVTGGRNEATGNYSFASGIQNKATGDFSHVSGGDNSASGVYATARGGFTVASGKCATSEGYHTTASGDYATASGQSSVASGHGAHASGVSSVASGKGAMAMGINTHVTGEASFAGGYATKAPGNQSMAVGNQAQANGDQSTAFGYLTKAKGARAYAGGENSQAVGARSFAHGANVVAQNANSAAFGYYNDYSDPDTLFSVGNGNGDKSRSNAFEVTKSGTAKLGGNSVPVVSSGQEALLYIGDTQPAATAGKITVWINLSGAVKIIQ